MIDDLKHKGKRNQMIDGLKILGIIDKKVLISMNLIPRHLFINSIFEEYAYQNKAFPIESNQTISHPYTVAFQSELLKLKSYEKVLEIGTGSGYQTAILVNIKCEVYTIERQKILYESSKRLLAYLNLKPKYQVLGDGYKGLPSFAPFDKIIITAGSEFLPNLLLKQLKIGGLMVIPIGKETQIMTVIQRLSETDYEKKEFGEYTFVPMLKDTIK